MGQIIQQLWIGGPALVPCRTLLDIRLINVWDEMHWLPGHFSTFLGRLNPPPKDILFDG